MENHSLIATQAPHDSTWHLFNSFTTCTAHGCRVADCHMQHHHHQQQQHTTNQVQSRQQPLRTSLSLPLWSSPLTANAQPVLLLLVLHSYSPTEHTHTCARAKTLSLSKPKCLQQLACLPCLERAPGSALFFYQSVYATDFAPCHSCSPQPLVPGDSCICHCN